MTERTGRSSKPTATTIEGVIASVRSSQGLAENEPLDGRTYLLDRGLALDSVALLELALALEEHFEVRVEESELTAENFATVSAVAVLLERKLERLESLDA